MSKTNTRRVAAIDGAGKFILVKEKIPEPKPGEVLIEVKASLISPGTELGRVSYMRKNPQPETKPRKFGYSNAGIVVKQGQGCEDIPIGLEVACMGADYALHSDYACIPRNLLVPKPKELSFPEAAFVHLGATAMHAIRRAELQLGENLLIVGLGIIGQLAVQMGKLSGTHVMGMDLFPMRLDLARKGGAELVVNPKEKNPIKCADEFTQHYGLDCVLIAFGGNATEIMKQIPQMMKTAPDTHKMGRIVIVGGANFQTQDWPTSMGNIDIRASSRTGPGYHDEKYEHGEDYPEAFVQWTTKRNMEEFLRFAAAGDINLKMLITHRIPLDKFSEGAEILVTSPAKALGIILTP